jgi:hypothetical protein
MTASRSRALRLLAAALCLALLLTGCAPAARSAPPAADFDSAPQRANVAFADMPRVADCTLAAYRARADAVAAFADGGTQAAFDLAAAQLLDGLRSFSTAAALLDLDAAKDPADTALAQRDLTANDNYSDAWDLYWTAMRAVAASSHAGLLDASFTADQRDAFKDYVADDEGTSRPLYDRETALTKRYETLMAADPVDYDAVCDLYVELVALRQQIAAAEGYDTYAEYAYSSLYARSYTPADAKTIWKVAKSSFLPLLAGLDDVYDQVNAITDVDCTAAAVLAGVGAAEEDLAPEFGAAFRYMEQYGLCDAAPEPQKLSTGYTIWLYSYREPFIFNAASGVCYDYMDLFHEFGHFLNAFYCDSDPVFGVPDMDLSELQSQGMEMLALPYYERLFGAEHAAALRRAAVVGLMYSVADGALYDEFQQRVYAEKDLTSARVREIFAAVWADYGYAPYEGYQREWMSQIHNFEQPFYYISYAVSALPALELYTIAQTDPDDALARYRAVVTMNTEDWYFGEALKTAGLSDVFRAGTGRSIAAALKKSLR